MHKDIRDLFDQLDRLGVKVTHLWPSCGEPRSVFGHPPVIAVEFDAATLPKLTAALAASKTPDEDRPPSVDDFNTVPQKVTAILEAKLQDARKELDQARAERDQEKQRAHVAEASLDTLMRGLQALGRR